LGIENGDRIQDTGCRDTGMQGYRDAGIKGLKR